MEEGNVENPLKPSNSAAPQNEEVRIQASLIFNTQTISVTILGNGTTT